MTNICEKHRKFAAYWEEIGRPEIECKSEALPDSGFFTFKSEVRWDGDLDYRIAGDRHWKLRFAWVNSDKTLPIEVFMPGIGWTNSEFESDISKGNSREYRESQSVEEITIHDVSDKRLGIDATLAERGSRYGSFDEHARITQNIKRAMADSRNWAQLSDDKKEALEMLAHKMGRILNGDPNYHDSWHDIIGYTKLVADRLEH